MKTSDYLTVKYIKYNFSTVIIRSGYEVDNINLNIVMYYLRVGNNKLVI